ncbi:Na/Pi cotransporter family protein [Neptunomonas japonica]|uniref:Phosphate:Na+ symporter n=1 Tax=Neptunomonas japonica JAMM 1380 TaxID=1441457 RepID=A0A7R6SVS3_9GAMM|nr:Na/Pi symporter [Neptunomonas japonica]BBB29894.1 phosphate:Na+ symporter [Neptunomonas japonica JAMM 1380]
MIKKIFLPTIFLLLTYGFWISPDFKVITAGVAIFLFGMLALEQGFNAFAGGTLERTLRKSTNKMWKSLTFGFTAATVMQSSSLVSVITISFLSAGLIGLVEGMGIIFGANVGSTTGAWLIAGFGLKVKISAYAMPMLVFGVIFIFQKSKFMKGFGYILAGLGFLFLGIHYMKEGFEAFQNHISLTDYAMEGFAGVLVFTLIGIVATIIMQSSHATLVLVITALSVHQVTYGNALALVIGANVGTTITAVLGSLTSNTDGKRLALTDVLFKVTAGVVFMLAMSPVIALVDTVSAMLGIADDDHTLKLALFHTIFNVTGVLLMVPFTGKLVSFLVRVMPTQDAQVEKTLYLSSASAEIPAAAIEAVRKETVRLYDLSVDTIIRGLSLSKNVLVPDCDIDAIVNHSSKINFQQDIDDVYERRIKSIYADIVVFVSQSQRSMGTAGYLERLLLLRTVGLELVETIKGIKHLQKNLNVYTVSENSDIRQEYNNMRIQICRVLQELEIIRAGEDESATILSLDQLKVEINEKDIIKTGRLDRLIREDRISAPMAISLMNDSTYYQDICRNLIHMGGILFISCDESDEEAENSIALDEAEIKEVVDEYIEGKSNEH